MLEALGYAPTITLWAEHHTYHSSPQAETGQVKKGPRNQGKQGTGEPRTNSWPPGTVLLPHSCHNWPGTLQKARGSLRPAIMAPGGYPQLTPPSQGLPEGRRPLVIPPTLWASVFLLQVENGKLHSPFPNLPFQADICQARSKQLENQGPMLTAKT